MQKDPKVWVLIHLSIELGVNVLEEVLGWWGTRPRAGAEIGTVEKVSRADYDHPDQQIQPEVSHPKPTPSWGGGGCEDSKHRPGSQRSPHPTPIPTQQIITVGLGTIAEPHPGWALSSALQTVVVCREGYTAGLQACLSFQSPNWTLCIKVGSGFEIQRAVSLPGPS